MNVETILRTKGREVATIRPGETVGAAVDALISRNIGALVVSEDGERVDGIISERDIVHALARHGSRLLLVGCRRGDDTAGRHLRPDRRRRRIDGRNDQPSHPPPPGGRGRAALRHRQHRRSWSRTGSTRSSSRRARCVRSSPAPEAGFAELQEWRAVRPASLSARFCLRRSQPSSLSMAAWPLWPTISRSRSTRCSIRRRMASGLDGARSSASRSLPRLRPALFQSFDAQLQPLDTGERHSRDAADHCCDRHEGHRCLVEEHRPTDEQRGETTKGRQRVPVPLHDPDHRRQCLKFSCHCRDRLSPTLDRYKLIPAAGARSGNIR